MAMIDDLVKEVRNRLGSPSESIISDGSLETAVNLAVEELSRVKPIYGYKQIVLRVGVPEYDVDEDVVNVVGFWIGHSSLSSDFGLEYPGMQVFHSPSLAHILEHKLEQWHYRYGYGWEWNPDTRKLLVMPTPNRVVKAVYKGTINRKLEDIPEQYMRAFKDLVYAESLEVMVNIRGGSGVSSVPIGIGNVTFDTSKIEEKAKQIRADAVRKLGGAGGAVVVG